MFRHFGSFSVEAISAVPLFFSFRSAISTTTFVSLVVLVFLTTLLGFVVLTDGFMESPYKVA